MCLFKNDKLKTETEEDTFLAYLLTRITKRPKIVVVCITNF